MMLQLIVVIKNYKGNEITERNTSGGIRWTSSIASMAELSRFSPLVNYDSGSIPKEGAKDFSSIFSHFPIK